MKTYSTNNIIELVSNGDHFIQKNLELISKAQDFIILQTYIFEDDEVTAPLINSLKQKAEKGVDVYLLIDGFGSREFPANTIHLLQKAGVKLQFFSPLISRNLDHLGRRLHSKALIIDGHKVLTGGINLSQRFNAPKDSPPWLDYSCLIEGEEVKRIIYKNLYLYHKYFPDFVKKYASHLKQIKPKNICLLKTNINDWMRLKNEVFQSYIRAIKNAREQIIIVAPYFFPGKKFLSQLSKAAQRGVKVDLIFSAVSDHPMERWSSKYLYSWFLSKEINIYEWGDSIVHGKLALIDHDWVTIGSYNHNFLSRFGNHELNIEIQDLIFAKIAQEEINRIKEKSTLITSDKWERQNSLKQKILEFFSFLFANLLTLISIFLVIRRKEQTDFNLLE